MALIKKFEDIVAWQEARRLVANIYRLTNSGALARDYGLVTNFNVPQYLP